MRIIERVDRSGPDRAGPWHPPLLKLVVSAVIAVVGLFIAGLVAPSAPWRLASFGLAWSILLALLLFGAAFALDARHRHGRGGK